MRSASNKLGLLPVALALLCWEAPASSRQALAAADGGAAGRTGAVVAPAKTGAGPSQSETGAVGSMGLEGQAATKTLRARSNQESRAEKAVTASQAGADRGARPAPPPQVAPPRLVQQVTAHLRHLGDCRRDVARDKHVPAAQVTAGALLVRWTIDVEGTVSAAEVVAQTPVDPALMECVKRAVTSWTFPPPDHGPLRIERRYQFRPAK